VPSHRSEDRISELCSKAVASDDSEFATVHVRTPFRDARTYRQNPNTGRSTTGQGKRTCSRTARVTSENACGSWRLESQPKRTTINLSPWFKN